MIADTTFLSHFFREHERGQIGPARRFMAAHRRQRFLTTVISAGEIAFIFESTADVRAFLGRYRILRLTPEIAYTAALLDRELEDSRLGENDNWIAGFCRYYSQPIISNDRDFDRVYRLRRLPY